MRHVLHLVSALLAAPLMAQGAKQPAVSASSEQAKYPAAFAADGSQQTFWVSHGREAGRGPSAERPETLDFLFTPGATLEGVTIWPRPKYGPAKVEVLASTDGKTYESLVTASGEPEGPIRATFNRTTATIFRLRITAAHDPMEKDNPRNVQVAEVNWKRTKPGEPGTQGK